MTRRLAFTPAEDAILMATAETSAETTNKRLRDAGFTERTANSIKQRRYYLRQQGPKSEARREGASLDEMLAARRALTERITATRSVLDQLRQELDELNARVLDKLRSVEQEVGGDQH